MQRWIARLLTAWMLLLLPGASALAVAQPQSLLPVCCRTHGAHHCSMQTAAPATEPAWRGAACPYQHLPHAVLQIPVCLLASPASVVSLPAVALVPALREFSFVNDAGGWSGSRAPPTLG